MIREEQLRRRARCARGGRLPGHHDHGRPRPRTSARRQADLAWPEFTVDLLPKVKLELIVADADATRIVQTIADNARTGAVGDGKIWVSTIESIMRVRTGETGDVAL